MNVVSFAAKQKRSISRDWLLGLTVGGYATLSVAFYFFGSGSWISSYYEQGDYPPGQLQGFVLLIPGLLIGLLDFAQIHSEVLFKRQGNERVTTISVWLNAVVILAFFALIPLNSMTGTVAGYLQRFAFIAAGLSFCSGIVTGVLHVVWILVARKTKNKPPGPFPQA